MPVDSTHDSSNNEVPIRYAGFSVRGVAAIIDFFVFFPAIGLSTYNQLSLKSLTLELCMIVILMLYKPYMEWRYGATLGKMAMKIRVEAEVGGPMTVAQSFVRSGIFMASSVISAMVTIDTFQNPIFQDVHTLDDLMNFQQHLSYGSAQNSLGAIMILAVSFLIFDPRHQGVHDKMARSLVVY